MKTQTAETIKEKAMGVEKRASRKVKSKVKALKNRASSDLSGSMSGYSQQAQDLIDRTSTALLGASQWATDTAKKLPAAAKRLNLPDQRAALDFAEQRPLVVGAIGLGLGLFVGAMLPKMSSQPARRTRK